MRLSRFQILGMVTGLTLLTNTAVLPANATLSNNLSFRNVVNPSHVISVKNAPALPPTLPSHFKHSPTTLNRELPFLMAIRPDCYRVPMPNCGLRMSGREVQYILTGGVAVAGIKICAGTAGTQCHIAAAIIGSASSFFTEILREELGRGNCLYIDTVFRQYHRVVKCNSGRSVRDVFFHVRV